MAQRDSNSREQFADAERLGEVVVGARIERCNLVFLLSARRQDDHRRRKPFAQASEHVEPVLIGQAKIENNQVGRLRSSLGKRTLSGFRLDQPIALSFQRRAYELADRAFVFDQQNECGVRHARPLLSSSDGTESLHDWTTGCLQDHSLPARAASAAIAGGGSPKGRLKETCSPPPARFSAQIRPPCAVTMALQMARPNPA